MIVWLEDPKQWPYLRESTTTRGSRRGYKRGAKLDLANFYKLVGYELMGRVACGTFQFRIFWLKDYDKGCPNGDEGYDKFGGCPCEGRDVTELLKMSAVKEEQR